MSLVAQPEFELSVTDSQWPESYQWPVVPVLSFRFIWNFWLKSSFYSAAHGRIEVSESFYKKEILYFNAELPWQHRMSLRIKFYLNLIHLKS